MVVLIPFLIIVAFLSGRLVDIRRPLCLVWGRGEREGPLYIYIYIGNMQLVWVYVCVHAFARVGVAPRTRCHSNQLPVSSEVGGETSSCFHPFDAKIPTTNTRTTGIIHCRQKHGRTKTTLPFDLWLSNYVVKEIQIKYRISNVKKIQYFLELPMQHSLSLSLKLYIYL